MSGDVTSVAVYGSLKLCGIGTVRHFDRMMRIAGHLGCRSALPRCEILPDPSGVSAYYGHRSSINGTFENEHSIIFASFQQCHHVGKRELGPTEFLNCSFPLHLFATRGDESGRCFFGWNSLLQTRSALEPLSRLIDVGDLKSLFSRLSHAGTRLLTINRDPGAIAKRRQRRRERLDWPIGIERGNREILKSALYESTFNTKERALCVTSLCKVGRRLRRGFFSRSRVQRAHCTLFNLKSADARLLLR